MADKRLDRLARMDSEIAALRAKLDAKLDARKAILDALIAEGEEARRNAADAILPIAQALSFISNGRALSDDDIRTIRREYKDGLASQAMLARRFGISQVGISKIVHRQSYKDVV